MVCWEGGVMISDSRGGDGGMWWGAGGGMNGMTGGVLSGGVADGLRKEGVRGALESGIWSCGRGEDSWLDVGGWGVNIDWEEGGRGADSEWEAGARGVVSEWEVGGRGVVSEWEEGWRGVVSEWEEGWRGGWCRLGGCWVDIKGGVDERGAASDSPAGCGVTAVDDVEKGCEEVGGSVGAMESGCTICCE